MASNSSLRKRKQGLEQEMKQAVDDLQTLKRICMRYRECYLSNLERCPNDMRTELEAIFDESTHVACLQTPGMMLLAALEEARNSNYDGLHTFMQDVKSQKITVKAQDLLLRTSDGLSIAHAVVEYIADREKMCETLQAIVEMQVIEDTASSMVQAHEQLTKVLSRDKQRQLIAQVLFHTELKPASVFSDICNTACFCSVLAFTKSVQECAGILQVLDDVVRHGTNKHKHSLLGVAAAACAHGKHNLLQAIVNQHTGHASTSATPSIWQRYTSDETSGLFTEIDANGLTPFAYIVMFGKAEWLQTIKADVLKNVMLTALSVVVRDVLSVYYPHPPLFPALMDDSSTEMRMRMPLQNSCFMYLHLAALAPKHEMMYALLHESRMTKLEILTTIQSSFIQNGPLNNFTVSTCIALRRDAGDKPDHFFNMLLAAKPREEDGEQMSSVFAAHLPLLRWSMNFPEGGEPSGKNP